MCLFVFCRARSAYIMFTQVFRKEREERAKSEGRSVSPQELMALAASTWKTMGPEVSPSCLLLFSAKHPSDGSLQERRPFDERSAAERAVYEARYREWKLANPLVDTKYNKNTPKVVGLPNRSAYFIFLDALREFEGEGLSEVELLTQGQACWEGMNARERRLFQAEAKREREEFRALNPSARKQAKKRAKKMPKEEPVSMRLQQEEQMLQEIKVALDPIPEMEGKKSELDWLLNLPVDAEEKKPEDDWNNLFFDDGKLAGMEMDL